jgi:hypothetical protein
MSDKDMTERSGLDTPKITKLETILGLLVSGRSLNRFEAEQHHDHCLHTTVSTLQNGHGVTIERMFESVPCKRGTAWTRVCRYWLNNKPDNTQRARDLLAKLGRKT